MRRGLTRIELDDTTGGSGDCTCGLWTDRRDSAADDHEIEGYTHIEPDGTHE